ncbi:MAG: redoxin family protein [Niastella sp.]|nr:redoxin family protein [Niastella sp.]
MRAVVCLFLFVAGLYTQAPAHALNRSAVAAKPVMMTGYTDNPGIKNVAIVQSILFYTQMRPEQLAESSQQDGRFHLAFLQAQPGFVYLTILGKAWAVYVQPGDNIVFRLSGSGPATSITFEGEQAATQQLFAQLSELTSSKLTPRYGQNNDPAAFKTTLTAWRQALQDSIALAVLKHPIKSRAVNLAQAWANYAYVRLIYSVLPARPTGLDASEYTREADKYPFNRHELLSLDAYRDAAMGKYVFRYRQDTAWSNEKIAANVSKLLQGKTRDHVLTNLIGLYAQKQTPESQAPLTRLFAVAKEQVRDSIYVAYLHETELKLRVLDKPLPDSILNSTYLLDYTSGKKLTLKDVLASYQGQPVYIDLWASWCIPCREDIAKSAAAKQYLTEKNVQYLYFSTDKDVTAWKKAAVQDSITTRQYVFVSNTTASLFSFLNHEFIPRYLLLDKSHKVKATYAPRPTPPFLNELKALVGSLEARVVTFN